MTEPDGPREPASPSPSWRERARRFWARHRTLFWTLHTGWALLTGVVVVILARERYEFVPWVVVFLGLTWASTLFFGGGSADGADGVEATGEAEPGTGSGLPADTPPTLGQEVTSYATRTLYQETLFFLLPFYATSTVLASPNVLFLALLGGLAVFSCLDLLFDRWLRTRPVFGLVFFAVVAFAAVNLLLPMLLGLDPVVATPVAAAVAVGSALPLAVRTAPSSGGAGRWRLAGAAAVLLGVGVGVPALVPPVPLRLEAAAFGPDIERETLALPDTLEGTVPAAAVGDRLVVVVQVFAPTEVPARVWLEWSRDGEALRSSREVEITAHEWAFRVWDAWSPTEGPVEPGAYRVVLRTHGGRIFGVARLRVVEAAAARVRGGPEATGAAPPSPPPPGGGGGRAGSPGGRRG